MIRKHRCGGDCESCRRGCERSENMKTGSGSELADIARLGDYLSERYTATTLVEKVQNEYDPEYISFFGIGAAMQSFLTKKRDRLGLKITDRDIARIAHAVVERGDIVY